MLTFVDKKQHKRPKKIGNKKDSVVFKCENCGHESVVKINLKLSTCNESKESKESNKQLENLQKSSAATNDLNKTMINFPVCVQIKHKGFWITNSSGIHESTFDESCNNNSIMLSNDCLLYVYKLALRHLLLSTQVITPAQIDPANLVPHIKVRKDKNDPFSKFKTMQDEKFIIKEDMVSVKKDFIMFELDEARGLHFTLIYSRNISKKIDLLESIKSVISTLNENPALIGMYSSLPYFGQKCIEYWYDVPESYPLCVVPPVGNVPKPKLNTINFENMEISAAGTVRAHCIT
ncbi:MAG: hypothetical protein Satyrvirus6_28 [Satyrvirus sp.]|uniref:Uncharacterized protein n=1 Tax=Satyrvirus sp. TaxID=2487771 RepID=A0A3G5ADA2_9VIRU|nr:MAG: hypothetical protein Satyrvirus6_28 [Satyrvirus sp.]